MLCLICDEGDNKGRYDYGFMSVLVALCPICDEGGLRLICDEGDNKGRYDYACNRLGD